MAKAKKEVNKAALKAALENAIDYQAARWDAEDVIEDLIGHDIENGLEEWLKDMAVGIGKDEVALLADEDVDGFLEKFQEEVEDGAQ